MIRDKREKNLNILDDIVHRAFVNCSHLNGSWHLTIILYIYNRIQ